MRLWISKPRPVGRCRGIVAGLQTTLGADVIKD